MYNCNENGNGNENGMEDNETQIDAQNDYADTDNEDAGENRTSVLRGVSLRAVDGYNWKACVDMSVTSDQEAFVAENWYSLLQWKFSDDMHPYCVYADDVMVGFVMYGLNPETHRWFLMRLMIDAKQQGKGYGKRTLLQILGLVREHLGNIPFYVCVEEDNERALGVYESVGFEKTGEVLWEELVLRIVL